MKPKGAQSASSSIFISFFRAPEGKPRLKHKKAENSESTEKSAEAGKGII
jgi:hypothetical protein